MTLVVFRNSAALHLAASDAKRGFFRLKFALAFTMASERQCVKIVPVGQRHCFPKRDGHFLKDKKYPQSHAPAGSLDHHTMNGCSSCVPIWWANRDGDEGSGTLLRKLPEGVCVIF